MKVFKEKGDSQNTTVKDFEKLALSCVPTFLTLIANSATAATAK